ncbi:hypothetical protein FKP32DRAFT_1623459 [Trametes sanguinea]|nr:hypothetical protein FKP32DRAFT_1623459 [Trametes sanguinea]
MERRDSVQFASKFATTYSRLLQGNTPEQLSPNHGAERFWSELLDLDVDRDLLSSKLNDIRKDDFLSRLKPILNGLVDACIRVLRSEDVDEVKKSHAAVTLGVVSRSLLSKNLAGWEVMEVFAGGVADSDRVFNGLTSAIDEILSNTSAPASLRHEVLQMAVIFVCGISQLSPGAYFLRHDLFPCIVTTITSPETEQYTFEAALLLALLANFHKSDAAKLNPYLRCIRETTNEEMMHKICWAANFAAAAVVKAYQSLLYDSPPTLTASLGSFLSALRPDRAFASTPVDPPRELFKNQPIEACVILLPLFEFLHGSETFRKVFAETLTAGAEKKTTTAITPLPLTMLSLFSYLVSHASSSSSARAIPYANLSLNTLLVISESNDVLAALTKDTHAEIRICRQRLPPLPPFQPPRSPICALLDCCILWLRHNLHKKLEVHCYLTCTRIVSRVLWYLQKEHVRLDYHWQELWRAMILLLDFLANKLEGLITTGGVEQLVQETLLVIDFALCRCEQLLPSPQAVHELVYEAVRSAEVFRKQQTLLEKLSNPHATASQKRLSGSTPRASQALSNIIALAELYEAKLREAGVRSANQGLRAVAKEIEKDGLTYGTDLHGTDDPPKQSEDVVGFIRFAYTDGMALMS